MSTTKQKTSPSETAEGTDAMSTELLLEEGMENGTRVLHTSTMNGPGVAADNVNRLPIPMETSSHVSALSFVSGPTLTAGSVSSVAVQATPATYIPVQVPGVIETAFTQTPAFAAPLIYPSALTTAYIASAAGASPATPCTFLSAGTPITAVCHCVYAQPCALHHRPITYTPHSFSSLGTVPSHSHTLPAPTTAIAPLPVPSLPPTLALPSLRSTALRLKRSSEQLANHPPSVDLEGAANSRLQKMRRVDQSNAEATTSDLTSQRYTETRPNEGNAAAGNSVFCCDCRSRATCMPCPCHHHHHHICPRHPTCLCQRNFPAASHRREADINPVHDMLISSRMAQIERQQQANNWWFQRQSVASGNLVGVDIVARRVASHPLVILPRHQQPFMELAMVLLQPHDPAFVLGGNIPPSNDPIPIGATAEQINRFSTMYKYVKENNVPENEQERCTVCLNDFESNEEVRALGCNHVFHVLCIDRWLLYNKKCPVCRLDLDKSSGEPTTASS